VQNNKEIIIELYADGKTEIGDLKEEKVELPESGVLPRFLHKLCGSPTSMRIKCFGQAFLQKPGIGKGLQKKVQYARRQGIYNMKNGTAHAAVYVVDSEGELKTKKKDLMHGRDLGPKDFPMAVGVAHPCIESWLLCDAHAIQRALNLSEAPPVPETPEDLPAPQKNRENNPKTALRDAAGSLQKEISVDDKDRIAGAMNDLELVKKRCPLGFEPFAEEVEMHIRPLFSN
jgi:hypothetical protein